MSGAEFLAQLAAAPHDVETRLVYADWLEERGDVHAAEFVRRQCVPMTGSEKERRKAAKRLRVLSKQNDARWRRIVASTPIEKCSIEFAFRCPKRWDALVPTESERERHCAACERRVHYCSSLDEVREQGRKGACVAFDASLLRSEALSAYDLDDEVLMGEIAG